ncbi:MAG TPA: flagellar basal-body rod protein FlgF [Micavibrio sp.]|nr:flagellar basal-body rod protein FlgF [Pseudomonadota bacterium]HIF24665.1 flagellar basal-body rod protein FlgF [Micavibrio sp.]HIL29627.1 flagellar basal-body rod protein FlgF [Micavibrio sp.]
MENPIFIGLSRQVALRSQMDLIANNIANMSTPGYRAQNMVFTEYLALPDGKQNEISEVERTISQVLDYGHYQDTAPGPMEFTGNPLNAGLAGPGYFGVQAPDGETAYSRNGIFQINANGELVTGQGLHVLDEGGGIITIPDEGGPITIGEDGSIANEDGVLGKLMVSEFENLQELEAFGDNLYKTDAAPQEAINTRVKQGMIEGSNVKPVLEMTRMIEVSRAYQSTQNMLKSEHDRQRSMLQRLTSNN